MNGRPTYYLLYFHGEFLIHSPSLIPTTRPRPRARSSFIRPANYESSRRMSNRLNCEAPPQPKARAARESVSSCADCATATQPRAPIPVLVPARVPVPVPVRNRTSISESEREREDKRGRPDSLRVSLTSLPTRDPRLSRVCACTCLFRSFLVINA